MPPRFRDTASSSKQALSCESHFERHRPTLQPKPHPILVRPPSAPNGLTRRGITSKNTFHRGRRDAIATGLCLSSPWMEMLVFAAMVALYGGLPVTFTRVTRVVLLPIMYSIHGHPFAYSSRATYFQHVHSGIQTKHFNELIQLASVEFCDS